MSKQLFWLNLISFKEQVSPNVPDGLGLENREVSCGAAGLSMSVAGEVGIGIRSPPDESWPLRLWEGGEVGPSLLAEIRQGTKLIRLSARVNRENIVEYFPKVKRKNLNLRVAGSAFLPRLRPPGVEAGEDMVGRLSGRNMDIIRSHGYLHTGKWMPRTSIQPLMCSLASLQSLS